MRSVFIDDAFVGWRAKARELLQLQVPPAAVSFAEIGNAQGNLLHDAEIGHAQGNLLHDTEIGHAQGNLLHEAVIGAAQRNLQREDGETYADFSDLRVPREFLRLAESVSYHSDSGRWHALYRVLFRLTHGEPSLLEVATDPDIYRLFVMDKAIRREVHKMHAFVRFRAVDDVHLPDATHDAQRRYVAWFEPAHDVLRPASGLFVRRFTSMHWSILTPLSCAHWDGHAIYFTPGVSRATAPQSDELEELWRSYYAHIFNPARVATDTMQAEMPRRYWKNLPEAQLISSLTREAPARVARMLSQLNEPAADIPQHLRSQIGEVSVPPRALARVGDSAVSSTLDIPGAWDVEHDPGVSAARLRATPMHDDTAHATLSPHALPVGVHDATVRIGTASWTDPTLLQCGAFYPVHANTAEARLQYYASRHALVEVDSTYYVPPTRAMAAAWASRTHETFVFDIKAYALMTGHAAEVKRMPDWLRRLLPRSVAHAERMYAADVRPRIIDEVWGRFLSALSPLDACGKLGPILLQFPRWFIPSRENAEVLRLARERLGNHAAAVEFRNPDWVSEKLFLRTTALLEKLQLTYVIVDAPQGTSSSMPPVTPITTPGFSVVRLHGRRVQAWEARHSVVSERYRYLYDQNELTQWRDRVADIAYRLDKQSFPDMAKAKQGVHMVFNNCHANYGTTNADEITRMLIEFDKARRI